jgi:T-complex protein 1 subunit eta
VLVQGVAFKKTFAYAGFEQQPKSFKSPKIVLLNVELEVRLARCWSAKCLFVSQLKSERQNAEIRISDTKEYQVNRQFSCVVIRLCACHLQRIVDAEWKIIYDKLDKIVARCVPLVAARGAVADLAHFP